MDIDKIRERFKGRKAVNVEADFPQNCWDDAPPECHPKNLQKARKAQNKRDERARKSHGGLFIARQYYTHPDDEPRLRALELKLREQRITKNPHR